MIEFPNEPLRFGRGRRSRVAVRIILVLTADGNIVVYALALWDL